MVARKRPIVLADEGRRPNVPARWQAADPAPFHAVIFLCFLGELWLAMLLVHAGPVDHVVYSGLHAPRHSLVVTVARAFTRLGGWPVLELALCAGALLLLALRRPWLGLLLLAADYLGHLLVHWQKLDLGLARPDQTLWLVHVNSSSFPSGHAAQSMFVYLTIALLLTKAAGKYRWLVAPATLLAVLVGLSRVVLGVHWPTDVIAGWSFGAAWAVLCYFLAAALDRFVRPHDGDGRRNPGS
jgi:undecaprenyl-diphosphatase